MARINNLSNFLTDVADSIRSKTGKTALIPCADFDTEIESIQTGGSLQTKTVTVTQNGTTTILPDSGYDGLEEVDLTVNVSGGGDTPSSEYVVENVNFLDYDGKTLYSYTLSEIQALTELPELPNHTSEGLISQTWNWTLAELKARNDPVDVGVLCNTPDGGAHMLVYISPYMVNKNSYINISKTSTTIDVYYSIDWGDGTISNGSMLNRTTTASESHVYTSVGYRRIKITNANNIDGQLALRFTSSKSAWFFSNGTSAPSTTTTDAQTWSNSIIKIHIGSHFTFATSFNKMQNLKELVVSDTTWSNAGGQFNNLPSLRVLILPKNISSIAPTSQSTGFSNSYNLEHIVFSNHAVCERMPAINNLYLLRKMSIPNETKDAFSNTIQNNNLLEIITFPNTFNSLQTTMGGAKALKHVTLSSSITTTLSSTFANCYNLKSVTFKANSVSFGGSLFQNCYSLESIDVFNNVPDNTFQNCYNLEAVEFKGNPTSLGASAFQNCISLKQLEIPNSVTSIGNNCFNCTVGGALPLRTFDFSNFTSVPTLGTSVFTPLDSSLKIIVPDDLYNDWIATANWSDLTSYIVKASEV